MNFMDQRLPDRFWSKCMPEPNSGCWLWHASRCNNGYGLFGIGARRVERAHSLAYKTLVGPVPIGLELDHLCRVRECCNPRHLEAVTHAENVRRGAGPAGIKAYCKTITHCPKGHEYTAENTRYRRDERGYESRQCKECSRANCRRWQDERTRTLRDGDILTLRSAMELQARSLFIFPDGPGERSRFRKLERLGLLAFEQRGVDENNHSREVSLYSITPAGVERLTL